MTVANGIFQKGNFKITVDKNVIAAVDYSGADYRALLDQAISETLNGGNRAKLQNLSDELFTVARQFDETDRLVELSIYLTNFCFETFTGPWNSALSRGADSVAALIMGLACQVAWEWEGKNQPYQLHKGTP